MSSAQTSTATDIVTQDELEAIADKQSALFDATCELSKHLKRVAKRLAAGAKPEPGPYVFDAGRVLVRRKRGIDRSRVQ